LENTLNKEQGKPLQPEKKAQGNLGMGGKSPLIHAGIQALLARWRTKTRELIGVQMSWRVFSGMVADVHAKPANLSSA